MKLLNGAELAEYIKERQAYQVRVLRQSAGIEPRLAIIVTGDNPVIDTYVRLKQQYGIDIQVDVDVYRVGMKEVPDRLAQLNADAAVQAVIIQLPLADPTLTDELVNLIDPNKDVDALGKEAPFEPATPLAIMWLLAGYNIDLRSKRILIVGRGRLVGQPLEKILATSGNDVTSVDRETADITAATLRADIIITATGQPGVLTSAMLKPGAVVVDAGVASEKGKTIGDVASEVYRRNDLMITPAKGGVGPLTVCALFENVIRAAQRTAGQSAATAD